MKVEDARKVTPVSQYQHVRDMPAGFYDGCFARHTGLFLRHYDGLIFINDPMATWDESEFLTINNADGEFMIRIDGRIVIERNL